MDAKGEGIELNAGGSVTRPYRREGSAAAPLDSRFHGNDDGVRGKGLI